MGMFDTIHLPKPATCVACQAAIASTQTKAFDSTLEDYWIGDCVGHAEEIRIVRETLYCEACRTLDRQAVYLVVYRGILVDIAADLEAAEAEMRRFSLERLILWYHDLCVRRDEVRREREDVLHFLRDVVRWFGEKYDQMPQEERARRMLLFWGNRSILEAAAEPLDAIRAYLERREQQATGDE